MELNKKGFSLAAANTMGVIYLVCAVFVALWPVFSLKLFGWLAHLVNVDKFAGDVAVTAGGFTGGLVQVWVYTYVGAWIFAWLHNRSVK